MGKKGRKGEVIYYRLAISRTVPLKIYKVYLDAAPDWDGEGDEDQEVGAHSDYERAQSWVLHYIAVKSSFVFKGTVCPDYIGLRVVKLERPRLGHSLQKVLNFF
jgi:hypothetical protein